MRFVVLGSGCPALHPRRAGAGLLVESGTTRLLVDCGHGVAQRLAEAKIRASDIDAVLATHLHTDHLADLWTLVVGGWHQGRLAPLRLLADPAVARLAHGLSAAWAEEGSQRVAFERRPNPEGLGLRVETIAAGARFRIGAIEVETVAVDHRPVEAAMGFVFRAEGRVLAVSGDTRPCPGLVAAARGCDVLVHEVFVHHAMHARPGVRTTETIDAVASYHTRSSAVGRVAAEAGTGCLVLTHLVPPEADTAALLAEVRRDYAGPIIVAEDLLSLDLATLTLEWRGLAAGFLPTARAASAS